MMSTSTLPEFPYKKTFITTLPQEFFSNLTNDEIFNTLITATNKDGFQFPIELFVTKAAYRAVAVLTDLFTEEARMQARLFGQFSPLEFWKLNHKAVAVKALSDPDLVEKLIDKSKPDNYACRLVLSLMCKEATTFSPVLSRKVYDLFLDEPGHVLDPFSGWGDRAIGALASKKVLSYNGVDCNKALVPGYSKLKDCLDSSNKLTFHSTTWQRFVSPPEHQKYDFIFTSPPYFDFEIYSDDLSQSCTGQATYGDWWTNFMQHALRKMTKLIKPGGYIALHIGHTYRTPTFTEDIKTLMVDKLGMTFVQSIDCLTFSKTKAKPTRPISIYVYRLDVSPSASPGCSPPTTTTGEGLTTKRARVA